MRRAVIFLAIVLLAGPLIYLGPEHEVEGEAPSRSVSFTDVGLTSFDQTSAPTFISAVDWNNDGYTDLLFNGYRLFKNNGPPDWDFSIQSTVFNGSISGARNGVWADWDGDGDQDLYQGCNKGIADRFWENQGAPDFILEDKSTDVFNFWQNLHPNTGNAWGDFDRDGDLDLYVGNGEDWNDGNPIYYQDYLLRNDGGSGFTDISSTSGIRTGENFYSRGVTWGDYNNDHWQDAYVSHYRIRENHLFENQHDGTFDEVGQEMNCSGTFSNNWYYDATAGSVYGQYWWGPNWGHTIGSSWADFNRDGNLDLWTSDFVHKYVGYIGNWYDIRGYVCDDANLYINEGAPYYTFTDYRNTSGIPKWPIGGSGTYQGDQTFSGITIGDYDNDGWEDMYIPQVYGDLSYTTPLLFHNKGYVQDGSVPDGTTFEDVTDSLGIKGANTYANLWVDYDNDGDLDLVTGGADTWNGGERIWENYRVRLYQNQGTGDNEYLRIQLNGTGMNPDAVGARVTMVSEQINNTSQILTREVRAGTGHAHQGSNILHFGLGSDLRIEDKDLYSLEVVWPDGHVEWVRVRESETTLFIDQPSTDLYPTIDSVTVSPRTPKEDETITVTVTATPGSTQIWRYYWDLDSDNHYDEFTTSNSISFIPRQGGLKQIRCRVVASDDWANFRYMTEVYPIEIIVENVRPEVDPEQDIAMDMDEMLVLSDGWIIDTPSDRNNITWNVDWGDGNSNHGTGSFSPNHTYSIPGTFDLVVTVEDEEFVVEGETRVEVLNVLPWGWIEHTGGNRTSFLEDESVSFSPFVFDSPSDTGQVEIKWDFGDGTVQGTWSDMDVGVHRYERSGNYSVQADIRDQYGGRSVLKGWVNISNKAPMLQWVDDDPGTLFVDEDSILDLDDIVQGIDTDSDQDDLEYQWDFGDGNLTEWLPDPDTGHVYQYAGTYEATCTVRDDDGATDSIILNIGVRNLFPEIIEISPLFDVYEDEIVEITISAKDSLSDRDNLLYQLLLEDNTKLISENGTFHFSRPDMGYHEIMVFVIDDDGATDEETIYLNVLNMLPRGEIFTERNSYSEDEVITFSAVDLWDTSHDIQGLILTWDFDDNSPTIMGTEVNHTFTRKGRYTVKMTIDDGNDEVVEDMDIIIDNPVPTAVLEALTLYVEIGTEVTFSGENSTDNPSDIGSLLYLWDFDDGDSDQGPIVKHSFSKAGTYTVTLEVMDDDGATSYSSVDIEVTGVETGVVSKEEGDPLLLAVIIITVLVIVLALLAMGGMLIIIRRREQVSVQPIPPQHPIISPRVPPPSPPQPPPLPP